MLTETYQFKDFFSGYSLKSRYNQMEELNFIHAFEEYAFQKM